MNLTDFIDQNRRRYVDELCAWLRIPSISSSSAHAKDVARAAEHLAEECRRIGLSPRIFPTAGHPVVYAEWLGRPGQPTLLVYGHYDVQPVDPLDLWKSPPFEPSERNGELYARGAVDDKGQVWIHLKAIEAWMQAGGPPVNVKLIVEGEEEIGSGHLGDFLTAERARLEADAVIVSDSPMFGRGIPSICYGLRGLCYLQIEVEGPSVDLHSGSFGGAVMNPCNALAAILASLKDEQNRVRVEGFYDRVRPLTAAEREAMAALPFDAEEWRRNAGSPPALAGEEGYSTLERVWARPTLDVNGLWGGFSGEGSKTVIPAKAGAKVSMRLVPDQEPEEIAHLVQKHVAAHAPHGVKVTVKELHGGRPWLADTKHAAFQAAARALERAFGKKAVLTREGGSIPFLAAISEILKKPCVLMGFGLPDENSHAPNEKLDLENFHKGIHACVYLYEELAR